MVIAVVSYKTTQTCPEFVEVRSAWWRFRHIRAMAAGISPFSLTLEQAYSDLQH